MIKCDYIVFDVETGGLDENKNPITQYAAVILDGCTLKEKDRFETYIKPYNSLTIDSAALKATMVKMSDINNGVTVDAFVDVVTKWWDSWQAATKSKEQGRLIPVGHNVQFDIKFVDYALRFTKKGRFFDWHMNNIIDTFALGKMTWGVDRTQKLNLGTCCENAKIRLTDAHGAMNDVIATAELLRWYAKKMRVKQGRANGFDNNVDVEERKKGNEFFEFKCAK